MSARSLPTPLVSALAAARHLEHQADTPGHHRAAVLATSRLLLAAHEAGWLQTELAAAVGLSKQGVQARIATARRDPGGPVAVEPPPAGPPPSRRAMLRRPVAEREWLTLPEAAAHVDRHEATVLNWLARGVLPNTDRRSPSWFLYSRADLDRVLEAPRRGRLQRYPDFAWLESTGG